MAANINGYLNAVNNEITKNKEYLTELDGVIGDADHGINMARGFNAVVPKITDEDKDIGAILKKVGMTLISTVGGASGPLYGTAFMKAGAEAMGMETIDAGAMEKMLNAALIGIKDRGKAVKGEKTMIDSIEPALEALRSGKEQGKSIAECLDLALKAAEEGIEFTKTIRATKGRASYLGDRSIGHQDPGATSFYIMLKAATDYYKANGMEG